MSSYGLGAEAERLEAEERRRREEEEAYNKNLARMAEEQRQAAEKQAIERKKQKLQEEQALLKGKAMKSSRSSTPSLAYKVIKLRSFLSQQG